MSKKITFILFLLPLISVQVFAQGQVSADGLVLTTTGDVIESASVKIKETGIIVHTNQRGAYQIHVIPGSYTLIVSNIGFKTTYTKVVVKAHDRSLPSIILEAEVALLDEINIEGKTHVQEVREQAFNTTAVDLKKLYNTSGDVNQVLNRTTGVRVRESGGMGSDFSFSLNGFSGNQIKFFLDGIPIDNYGSSFTLNNIPVNMAERIEIFKGVVPISLGGDALGGAVNIVTNQRAARYIDASYSVGSFNTHKAALNTRFSGKNGLIANVNGFINYASNSYQVDVSVADAFTGVFGPVQRYKHFHDGYKQGTVMAEVGVKEKWYADYLLVGMAASANTKEIQQGATMLSVIGDAFTESKNLVPSLKYKKSGLFTDKLTASLAASYNLADERKVDTSSARYNWAGDYSIKNYEGGGEVNPNEKSIMVFDIRSLQSNANLKYDFSDWHNLALNYTHVGYTRVENNEYDESYRIRKPYLGKDIVALGYTFSSPDQRLSGTTFGKTFALRSRLTTAEGEVRETAFHNFGYGAAVAYFVIPEGLQLKASYEHAYRLQSATELLGDGLLILPNPELNPESSDNYNLGVLYKKRVAASSLWLQGNFIYREAEDFIQNRSQGINSISVNSKNVRVSGVDGLVHYDYHDWVSVELNATYQKTKDMNPVGQYGTEQVNYLYKKQLPNIPIFYGNADVSFYFRRIRSAGDLLALSAQANYSDSYYLNYPSLGAPEYKKEIPRQTFYSIAASYSLMNGKYNVALECRNLTDTKLYDYFNVQKPGRSFTLKLRYFMM